MTADKINEILTQVEEFNKKIEEIKEKFGDKIRAIQKKLDDLNINVTNCPQEIERLQAKYMGKLEEVQKGLQKKIEDITKSIDTWAKEQQKKLTNQMTTYALAKAGVPTPPSLPEEDTEDTIIEGGDGTPNEPTTTE